jgi:hypothetical protein
MVAGNSYASHHLVVFNLVLNNLIYVEIKNDKNSL